MNSGVDPGSFEDPRQDQSLLDRMHAMFGPPPGNVSLRDDTSDRPITDALIAIVDDQQLSIKIVQKHLRDAGYSRFATTNDPKEALPLVETQRPDVVILDVAMPGRNGIDVLESIRARPVWFDLPVLMLTAETDQAVKLAALRSGATDFLGKPVDAVELQVRLRNVLVLKAHQDQLKARAWDLEREVASRTQELVRTHREVIHCLGVLGEYRDSETGNHIARVGRYAEIIAKRLGLPLEFVFMIRDAALLHDIGKIGIPDAILLKPGRLDTSERAKMQRHCEYGLISCVPGARHAGIDLWSRDGITTTVARATTSPVLRMAATIAFTHHEKWDGSGYPRGLAGEQIPLEGRITAVADVFDALTSSRPYKRAFTLEETLDIMRADRGSHFDPMVLDAFLDALDEILAVHSELADHHEPASVT